MKPPLFWDVTQRRFVFIYWGFGKTNRSHVQESNRPMGYPETSVNYYHSTLRNIRKESRSHLLPRLKPRITDYMDLIIQDICIRAFVVWDETDSCPLLSASELDSPCKGRDVTIKVSCPHVCWERKLARGREMVGK